jgi:FkbM family methyltransferase
MKRALSKGLSLIGNKILALSNIVGGKENKTFPENDKKNPQSIQAIRCESWFRVNGDTTLRLNYDLNSNSLVFDLGGYEGQWAADIFIKYKCHILIFEPYKTYAENIEKRFSHNDKVKVFTFGLSSESQTLELCISDDASSLFKKGQNAVAVYLKKASDFFKENKIDKIDLMKINIEGGEYDLLEHLIESQLIKEIKNLQVQFHDFIIPNAKERMNKIQHELSKTHILTYQYEFVWENWKLKDA